MFLPYQEIFLWSLGLALVLSGLYRIFTKPEEMRQIKKDMAFYREKSKEAQKNKDIKKANEYMSDMMKLSQKQMRINMKPMIIGLGIVLILLGFISQAYGGVSVQTTQLDEKTAAGYFAYGSFNGSLKAEKISDSEIKVTLDTNGNGNLADEKVLSKGDQVKIGGVNWAVDPQSLNLTKMDTAIALPFTMPFAGWTYLNWIAWYILLSFVGTLLFRKLLGVE
jgi:uncharacterized membrane protein (DUF106 family)